MINKKIPRLTITNEYFDDADRYFMLTELYTSYFTYRFHTNPNIGLSATNTFSWDSLGLNVSSVTLIAINSNSLTFAMTVVTSLTTSNLRIIRLYHNNSTITGSDTLYAGASVTLDIGAPFYDVQPAHQTPSGSFFWTSHAVAGGFDRIHRLYFFSNGGSLNLLDSFSMAVSFPAMYHIVPISATQYVAVFAHLLSYKSYILNSSGSIAASHTDFSPDLWSPLVYVPPALRASPETSGGLFAAWFIFSIGSYFVSNSLLTLSKAGSNFHITMNYHHNVFFSALEPLFGRIININTDTAVITTVRDTQAMTYNKPDNPLTLSSILVPRVGFNFGSEMYSGEQIVNGYTYRMPFRDSQSFIPMVSSLPFRNTFKQTGWKIGMI